MDEKLALFCEVREEQREEEPAPLPENSVLGKQVRMPRVWEFIPLELCAQIFQREPLFRDHAPQV